jgi:hypothetical protein
MGLVGSYFRPKPVASSGISAPTIKQINGVDYQWNSEIGQWEEVSIAGGAGASGEVDKTRNQISFLKNTIRDANKLVDATGPNFITQGLGNVFVGNTRVKQLQNKIDSLKTNLLTLSSDPNLKKFFGPQMTENDTKLLMSAGSTLDAYNNSVSDNEEEIKRYSELLAKMEKTLPGAQPTPLPQAPLAQGVDTRLYTGNLQMAPDGTQVEIID